MFNQKGFVIAPIVIWIVIGLIAAVAAHKEFDFNGNKNSVQISNNLTDYPKQSPSPIPIASSSDLTDPVKQYYSDISSKQYYNAWILLSKNFQNYAQGYDSFVKGYGTTVSLSVNDIYVHYLSNDTVFVNLSSVDNINGQIQSRTYSGTWKIVWEEGTWKLDTANIALLDSKGNPLTQNQPLPNPTSANIKQPAPSPVVVTNDGSRTGKIIDYLEMATGQRISVYENELLPYTHSDGTKVYLTQGDITWSETRGPDALCGGIDKIGTDEYTSCLSQMAAALGNLVIPSNSQGRTNSLPQSQYNPTYTYQPASQPTYQPYVYNNTPTTNTPTNNTSTSIPSYPSALTTPKDNGFNAVLPDGIQAHLTPTGNRDTYKIEPRNGRTWTGNCYNVGDGYMCGN